MECLLNQVSLGKALPLTLTRSGSQSRRLGVEQNQAEMPSALVRVVPFALVVALPH